MFDSEHGRPFVFGMNGTFGGTFIPQTIPLDAITSVQLPELVTGPGRPSAPEFAQFVSPPRLELSADNFVVMPTAQHAAPSAAVLPGLEHFAFTFSPQSLTLPSSDVSAADFGWDAPAPPVSDLHHWDLPVVSSWFDDQPFDSLGWDIFLY